MKPLIIFQLQKYERKWVLNDLKIRSLVKTVSWRITGSAATFFIAYLFTGDLTVAGVIGLVQLVSNTILHYLHERLWNRIQWGRD